LASALALLILSAPAQAQTPSQTPVRSAAERVAAALSGDAQARADLVRDGFSSAILEDQSAESWIAFLNAAAAASGGVDIVQTAPTESATFAEYVVRARNMPRFAQLVLGVSRRDPTQISTFYLLPARDPEAVRADAWPATPAAASAIDDEIARRVDNLVREDAFSGAVLVARRDRVVFERYAGLADAVTGARIGRNTRFNLGSAGKMFTAVAIGRLVQEGRISLDAQVGELVSDYPDAAGRAISVAQLLSHTSGLNDFFGPTYRANPSAYLNSASYLPLIAESPASFKPGAHFWYSNAGFALLGIIVERASGEDYFDYVQRVVFDRARMRNAGFPTLGEADPHRAIGYFRKAEDAFGLGARVANQDAIAFKGNAAGGAYATARDMLAFSRALLSHRLLSEETTAMFIESRNDFAGARTPARYGYGFEEKQCAGRAFIGHGGGGPQSGVNSVMLASADGEWTIVVLSNFDPPVAEELSEGICGFVALR
jgi:CubicO group peptidase (beta-lactamase class C family)